MKKIFLAFVLLPIILSNFGCLNNSELDIMLMARIHFYTPNDTSQLYLFSQGVDFGSVTVLDTFTENTSVDSLQMAEFPATINLSNIHTYEFIAKKTGVVDPIAEGTIVVYGKTITVENTSGTFEIDTTYVEFDLPVAVIKVDH